MTQISNHFIAAVDRNLRYWAEKAIDLSDETLLLWDRERNNLFRAIETGLKIGPTKESAVALLIKLFRLAEKRGYWQEWRGLIEQGLAVCTETQVTERIALLTQLGFLCYLEHQLETAISFLTQAKSLAEVNEDNAAMALTHFHLSNAYYQAEQYENLYRHAESALSLYQSSPRVLAHERMASLLNVLGLHARAIDKLTEAESYFQEAIAHWEKTTEQVYLARTMSNLGLTYCDMARFDQAFVLFETADRLLSLVGAEPDRVRLALNQGVAFYQLERWADAEYLFRLANSDFLRHSDDPYHQALVQNNLGSTLLRLGKLDEAAECLTQSIKLWRLLAKEVMLANSLGDLGVLYGMQRNWQYSVLMLQEAQQLLQPYACSSPYAQRRLKKIEADLAHAVEVAAL